MKTVLLFILLFSMMVPLGAQPNLKWQESLFALPTIKAKYNQGSFPGEQTTRGGKTHQLDSIILRAPAENSSNWIDQFRSIYQYTPVEKIASETSETYDEQFNSWENGGRLSYIYDNQERLIMESSLDWDAVQGEWVNRWKREYVYGNQDQLISESTYFWNEEEFDWLGSSKYTYTHDTSGSITLETYYNWDSFIGWYENSKDEYEYSTTGKLKSEINSRKETPEAEWVQTYRAEYTYDSLDQLTFTTHYSKYYPETWQLSYRYGLTYDAFGNVIEELVESWNEPDQIWSPSSSDIYSYDNEGHQISYYSYRWDGITQAWEGFYGGTNVYNEFGDYTEVVDLKWDEPKQDWLPIYKYEYGYDLSVPFDDVIWPYQGEDYAVYNQMLLFVNGYDFVEDWEQLFSAVCRYSFRTSTENVIITPLTISPNPAKDYIQVTLPDDELETDVEIHSIDGRKVSNANGWDSASISIQSLPSGIYTLRFQNGNTIYQGKFVKE